MAFVCTIRSGFGCVFSPSMGRAPLPLSKDRQTMLFLNSFPAGPVACMRGRENCWLNSESLRNGPSPTLTRHSLGSRSRNFHVICSPRTCPHYHWHLSPHSDTIVHSLYLRCATRMRTRTDCQGSVRMTQNKVPQCGPTPKISMLRAWKGKIGIQL